MFLCDNFLYFDATDDYNTISWNKPLAVTYARFRIHNIYTLYACTSNDNIFYQQAYFFGYLKINAYERFNCAQYI